MTNTSFRKKALLSSVAMLLVALVALGSATFAWFLANPTVTAEGMKVTASASAGLAIASESAITAIGNASGSAANAFGHSTQLDVASVTLDENGKIDTYTANENGTALTPASFYPVGISASPTFYTTDAEFSYDEAAPANASFNETTAVKREKILLRTGATASNDETAMVKGVKISITLNSASGVTNTALQKAIRVAVIAHQGAIDKPGETPDVSSSTQLIGIWKATGADALNDYVNSTHDGIIAGTLADAQSASYQFTASGTAKNATGSTNYLEVGNVINDSTHDGCYLEVIVYLDGEDSNCFTENVLTQAEELISKIDVTVSSAAVAND